MMQEKSAHKKILTVVDPTADEQPALRRAAYLAECLSTDLELFICYYDPDIAAGRVSTLWIEKPAREHLMSVLLGKLEELAAPLRERGLNVSVDLTWENPLDEGIMRKISSSKPWMVVKDAHHHNMLKRTILSNTDWSLIRSCPVPLLLVKVGRGTTASKICAAIDPTHEHDKPAELDDAIFDMADKLARGTGAELHVAHAVPVVVEPVGLEASPIGTISETISHEHEHAVSTFLKTRRVPETNVHLLKGSPEESLVQFVRKYDVDILVMGALSRRGLERLFIGNTAERLLERLPCDMLIVKSARARSALGDSG